MSTITSINGFPDAAPNVEILGEIVSWDVQNVEVQYFHLVEALRDSGLDSSIARELLPRNAFARAAKKLTDERIIRRIDEDGTILRFQFTREEREGGELVYTKEAILSLDKETGNIVCDDKNLEARAKAAFDVAMLRRTSSDVTKTIQRLFTDKNSPGLDLIPIRKQGGCYFVRREALQFVAKVNDFVDRLHGEFTRLPLASGFGTGEKKIAQSVSDKIIGLIGELDSVVEEFTPETSDRLQRSAGDRVKMIRQKVRSYAEYLQDEREKLDAALTESTIKIKAKVWGISEDEARESEGGD